MRTPRQVDHTPEVQAALDGLRDRLHIGRPDPDQSGKNPECALQAGTIECLNAADPMCQACGWWDRIAGEPEED